MAVRLIAVNAVTLAQLGYTTAVAGQPDINLVGQAQTAAAARQLVTAERPDVVAIDAHLPDEDAIALGADLRAASPTLGVVLVGPADDDLLLQALEAKLSAFVPRSETVEVLLAAVRHAAAAPSSFTAPDLAAAMARRRARSTVLSPRERQILGFLQEALSMPAIANRLGLTESTVRTYVARIYGKLGARSRAQALQAAVEQGLLSPEAGRT